MEGDQGSLTRAEIGKRTQRFASLRAAQRALSELAHVSDLEAMMAQGGELLVQLQRWGDLRTVVRYGVK